MPFRPLQALIDHNPATQPFTVIDLADHYDFPHVYGAGHRVGIVLLGGGINPDDPSFDTYAGALGIPRASIRVVPINGAKNTYGSYAQLAPMLKLAGGTHGDPAVGDHAPVEAPDHPDHPLHFLTKPKALDGKPTQEDAQWTGEGMMDLMLLMGLLPEARIVVYLCSNRVEDLAAAVDRAVRDGLTALSMSFSFTEPDDTSALDAALQRAADAGLTVCAASGNSGSCENGSSLSVGFPASSPLVLACGGTMRGADGVETAWNQRMGPKVLASGGGFSARYKRPPWQAEYHDEAFRGCPDVASLTAPQDGCWMWLQDPSSPPDAPKGINWRSFGTSSAAPVWAALAVRLGQSLHRKLGHLQPLLYKPSVQLAGFRDVKHGNNVVLAHVPQYDAGHHWDPVTGLGRPEGYDLLAALRSALS